MEERKRRFDDRTDVRQKLGEIAKKLVTAGGLFDGGGEPGVQVELPIGGTGGGAVQGGGTGTGPAGAQTAKAKSYHGTAEVTASTAKMRLTQLADEIINVLVSDPNAAVKVTLEIKAEFPNGAPDHVKRAVSESGKSLGLKASDWE